VLAVTVSFASGPKNYRVERGKVEKAGRKEGGERSAGQGRMEIASVWGGRESGVELEKEKVK